MLLDGAEELCAQVTPPTNKIALFTTFVYICIDGAVSKLQVSSLVDGAISALCYKWNREIIDGVTHLNLRVVDVAKLYHASTDGAVFNSARVRLGEWNLQLSQLILSELISSWSRVQFGDGFERWVVFVFQ